VLVFLATTSQSEHLIILLSRTLLWLKKGTQVKTIRFGQQGVTGDRQPTKRQASFKARHAKNIAKGNMSAAYWADKVKW